MATTISNTPLPLSTPIASATNISPSNRPSQGSPVEQCSILPLLALGCEPIKSPDGQIVFGEDGKLVTEEEFTPPFTLRVVAKTDMTNIRLYYGRGVVIFNWEVTPTELRYQDPQTGRILRFPGKGKVGANAFQDIQWVVKENGSTLIVNGQTRVEVAGDYRNLSDVAGISSGALSKLTLRHFSVPSRAPLANPAPPNLSSNLVLHFACDETSTNGVVLDLSPYHNNGRAFGIMPVPDGKLGGAFDFRGGSSNYIVVPHSLSLVAMQNTRQMTMAAWLKPRSLIGDYPVIISKGGCFPPRYNGGYELALNGSNDLLFQAGVYGAWTFGAQGRWIGKHLGEWVHVAVVINANTGLRKWYVNGRRTGDEVDYTDSKKINFSWPVALYIGVPAPNNHPNRGRYDGLMDDLRIYSRALTSEEIRELAGLANGVE